MQLMETRRKELWTVAFVKRMVGIFTFYSIDAVWSHINAWLLISFWNSDINFKVTWFWKLNMCVTENCSCWRHFGAQNRFYSRSWRLFGPKKNCQHKFSNCRLIFWIFLFEILKTVKFSVDLKSEMPLNLAKGTHVRLSLILNGNFMSILYVYVIHIIYI